MWKQIRKGSTPNTHSPWWDTKEGGLWLAALKWSYSSFSFFLSSLLSSFLLSFLLFLSSFLLLNFVSFWLCCVFTAVCRLLSSCGAQASHFGSLSCCKTQALGHRGFSSCGSVFSCSRACGICICRSILNHWPTREVLFLPLFLSLFCFFLFLPSFHPFLSLFISILPQIPLDPKEPLLLWSRFIPTLCFPDSSVGKESTCNAGDPGFDSWVRKIHWKKDRLPTPLFLGFPCGSAGKNSPAMRET